MKTICLSFHKGQFSRLLFCYKLTHTKQTKILLLWRSNDDCQLHLSLLLLATTFLISPSRYLCWDRRGRYAQESGEKKKQHMETQISLNKLCITLWLNYYVLNPIPEGCTLTVTCFHSVMHRLNSIILTSLFLPSLSLLKYTCAFQRSLRTLTLESSTEQV